MKNLKVLLAVGASALLLTGCFGSKSEITCTRVFESESSEIEEQYFTAMKYETVVTIDLKGKKATDAKVVNGYSLINTEEKDLAAFAAQHQDYDVMFNNIYSNKEGLEASYELTDRAYTGTFVADLKKFDEENYYLLPGFDSNVLKGDVTFDSINETMSEADYKCEQK